MISDEDFISELMATAFERPSDVAAQLPIIVPKMTNYMVDGRKRIRDLATKALLVCCRGLSNNDIRPFIPKLVECIEDPTKVPECIRQLAATTFVQSVDAPTLAITVPVLLRGLTERSTPIRRMSCVIIDTMAKLVDDPAEAREFVESLRTRVEHVVQEISHPEARKVAEKTLTTLSEPRLSGTTVTEISEENGTVLCDCTFSLAYGAKILLNNTRLLLNKGQRYGLCGPNGAGKSTLMRAIANGQVDGFPSADQVRTVYVEHDIDADQSSVSVHEFVGLDVASDPAFGFTPELLEQSIGSLSGGWKMKVALARAMAAKADILLLDEPTNHLDVSNVRWLSDYLKSLEDVTSMIVSHDSGFLDDVCTCIIHYETRKLVKYPGNLAALVQRRPEAMAYYTLTPTSSASPYVLPAPGFLEGVTSKDRAILKMRAVSFSYSGHPSLYVIRGASLQASLNSRVAVVGPNGAGKSTLIKLLTGELEPTEGTVWKHPNLRMAYVAQHAFHHIEHHLDKTPNQYIQWRYATGEDRESAKKVDRQMTQEDAQTWETSKRKPERVLGRRKLKQGYEYEVQWVGGSSSETSWLTRPALEALGCVAMVNEVDAREAAAAGMVGRPLTAANIERMLGDLGLDSEFATHSAIRGLSGGQKVKVVLGAVMWQQPHILVLDEPTNYLDRESLSALASALKGFEGGVVVISHHADFLQEIPCSETWKVGGGSVIVEGGNSSASAETEKLTWKRQDEVTDAFGNTIKVTAPERQLSRKELKASKKLKDARRARGEAVSDDEDQY